MPGSFLNIDTNFPTFTGQEDSKEQITEMLNYLRQLVDQLRYTLNNLDKSNFNRAALDEISEGSAGSQAEQIRTLAQQLNQTNSRITGLSTRIGTAEGNITELQQDVNEAQGTITTLQGAVQVDEITGAITIGAAGTTVNVDGDVYVNEGDMAALQSTVDTIEGNMSDVQDDMGNLQNDVAALQGAVRVDGNTGNIEIGGTGIRVDIDGDVYINGAQQ